MARADLLALTEAGLIQIANAGLVKRARRDLEAGQGPELSESAGGVIEARFADGVVTRLPPGRTPAEATCSCPSSGVCRHRIALVLAYQSRAADSGASAAAEDWDPAALDLESYEASLSFSGRTELQRLLAASHSVRLERGRTPAAHLPMATVTFLAPNDIAYARCDCVQTAGCVHVALAIRAFRASEGETHITLGAKTLASASDDLVAAVDGVLSVLASEGASAGAAAHGRGLDRAKSVAGAKGATWLVLAIEALAGQIEAYEARSAHYAEETVLSLAAELYARTRASDGAAALGLGEAMETRMAKTRLMSLGARAVTNGGEATVSALLVDTDTGAPMLLEKRFSLGEGDKREPPEKLGGRFFAPGLPVRGVARGQILTSVARRRADGVVAFGAGGAGKTTLMPGATLPKLPAPLWVENLDVLRARFEQRPPAIIRPRNRVQDMHVFDIEAVEGQAWSPGAQLWQAAVTLADGGGTLYLERRYDAAAPWALETLFAAADGKRGPVKRLAGTARMEAGEIVCEPWSLTADELIAPDLDSLAESAEPVVADSRLETASTPELARRFLAGAIHAGRRRRDGQFLERGKSLAADLRQQGFAVTAQRLEDWLNGPADSAEAFCRAATWVTALLES